MRHVELSGPRARLAPRHDEVAVAGPLRYAVGSLTEAVALRDEDVAVGSDHDVRGLAQQLGRVPCRPFLADGQEELSIRAPLEYLVSPLVRTPDVALVIHVEAVWEVEHSLAPARD